MPNGNVFRMWRRVQYKNKLLPQLRGCHANGGGVMDEIEYIVRLPSAALVKQDGEISEVCLGPVTFERPLIRCRDCVHYQEDFWQKDTPFGVPLIVAHEVCTFWAGGCKTAPDGFCHFATRRAGNG